MASLLRPQWPLPLQQLLALLPCLGPRSSAQLLALVQQQQQQQQRPLPQGLGPARLQRHCHLLLSPRPSSPQHRLQQQQQLLLLQKVQQLLLSGQLLL